MISERSSVLTDSLTIATDEAVCLACRRVRRSQGTRFLTLLYLDFYFDLVSVLLKTVLIFYSETPSFQYSPRSSFSACRHEASYVFVPLLLLLLVSFS